MKKFITLLLALISTSVFAEDCFERDAFTYIQIGGGAAFIGQDTQSFPALAFGRRYCTPCSAIDVSLHFAPGDHGTFLFSAPRVMYLHYIDNFYVGGGLSWSGFQGAKQSRDYYGEREGTRQVFMGVAGELAVGYEFCRDLCIRPFVQLSVTQPVFACQRRGTYPTPQIVGYLGAGF